MAESEFSWLKLASFLGAAVLVVLAFILIGSGISQVVDHNTTYGVASILGGLISAVVAYVIYQNYQRKTKTNKK